MPKLSEIVAQADQPTPQRTTLQSLGRAGAMTTRAAVQGLGGIAGLAWDPIAAGVNKLEGAVGVDQQKYGLNNADQNVNYLMDKLGLPNPQPENATERVVTSIDRGLGGLMGGAGVGAGLKAIAPKLASGGSSLIQNIGDMLTSRLGLQTASTVGGVGASSVAREEGAGPKTQLALGLAGSMLPVAGSGLALGARAGTAGLLEKPTPQAAQLAQQAIDMGIPLKASQVSPSPFGKLIDSVSGQIPFSGARAFGKTQQQGFNRAVGRNLGVDSPILPADVFANAKQGISNQFESVVPKYDLSLTPELMQKLRTVASDSTTGLGNEAQSAVNGVLDRVVNQSVNGVLPGKALQSIDSQLGRNMAPGKEASVPLGDIQDALREAIQQNMSPEDAALIAKARQQWKDMRTVLPLVADNPVEGNISSAKLFGRVNSNASGKAAMATGRRGNMGDVATIGRMFVKNTEPDSGTAKRNLAFKLLTNLGSFGAGAGVGSIFGAVPALAGAASTIGSARGIQSLLQNPEVVQRVLGNAPTINRGVRNAVGNSASPAAQALLQSGRGDAQSQPDAPSAPRMAPDGKMYIPDPNRPGKYLRVGN